MGKRRLSREFALQYLYACDIKDEYDLRDLHKTWEIVCEQNRIDIESPQFDFSEKLIHGYVDHKETIDDTIQRHSTNWSFSRIALIDRNLLRIAVFEIMFLDDVPAVVSIDEAVDIAKKFSTPDSGKFINGVLDKIKEELAEKKKS